jgi:hypothetical protein
MSIQILKPIDSRQAQQQSSKAKDLLSNLLESLAITGSPHNADPLKVLYASPRLN